MNSFLTATSSASWTSSNAAVATVNATGLATGQSGGSATITATYSDCRWGSAGLGNCPCYVTTYSANATVNVQPSVTSISPSGGLIGVTTSVTLSGKGFGTSPTVNAGTGITVTVNSASDTSIGASFNVASTAPSGNHSVTVTAGGQTSSNSVNFYVQVPTSLRLVTTTSQGSASCASGSAGWDRRVIWQVLDQAGQLINRSMSVSDTIAIGSSNTCGASTITGSATTDSTGQFSDHYFLCSTGCVGGTCQTNGSQTYIVNGTSLSSDVKSLVYTCASITINGQ